MTIKKINVSKLEAADYNPRIGLQPESSEYKKLQNSIEKFGYVEPIIWNEATGKVVGGHQRLKVLIEKGYTVIDVVALKITEKEEKILNVLLNKVKGRWDIEKLSDILSELNETGDLEDTGFEDWELQDLLMQYDHISDLMNMDFSDFDSKAERETFTMTFSFPGESQEAVKDYIENTENAKTILSTAIINRVKAEMNGAY